MPGTSAVPRLLQGKKVAYPCYQQGDFDSSKLLIPWQPGRGLHLFAFRFLHT
jgi:hypothetical protein